MHLDLVAKDAHTGCSPATENWTRQEGSKAVQCSFAENHPVEANNAQLWSGFQLSPRSVDSTSCCTNVARRLACFRFSARSSAVSELSTLLSQYRKRSDTTKQDLKETSVSKLLEKIPGLEHNNEKLPK